MPIYEFKCSKCGAVREYLFKSSDEEVDLRCEQCGCEEMERIVSRTSHFIKPSAGEGPSVTTRSCRPGSSCTSINLPGYTR